MSSRRRPEKLLFRIELPPGTYELRIAYEQHRPVRVAGVVVTAGKIVRVDAALELDASSEEDVVETVVEIPHESVEGLLLERQRSANAGDSIGRAEIAKSNDKNAAEAAKRVVGANIEGSRFLFVRGLGERYTNALLDGFALPSPEPDRQAVPLDLFPAQILDSLEVVKTFTPDVPGDFAGGSVRIRTRRIPNDLVLAGSISLGFNTNATFADLPTYEGGSLDWLGIDDGTRSIPDAIPAYKVGRGIPKSDGSLQTRDDVATIGKSINSPMVTKTTVGPPAHSGSFVFSNAWAPSSDVRIGTMAALVYDRKFERRVDEIIANYTLAPTPDGGSELTRANDLRVLRGIDHVSWGGLAGVTLELGKEHRFSLTGLHTRAADIEASELEGYHEERAARIHESRLSFVSRSLTFGQLSGEHTIHPLNDMVVSWGLGIARATRDEPDTRASVYQYDGTLDVWAFEDDSTSGSHFYATQGETTYSGTLDVKQPLGSSEHRVDMKVGGAVSVRARSFEARRFRFRPNRKGATPGFDLCPGATYDRNCPGALFTDENIASGALELEEGTRDNDGYDAGLGVYAAYAMVDADVAKGWRVVAGPRLEVSSQDITPFNPVSPDGERVTTDSGAPALLPSASLVWTPISKANVRASLTKTVARPQLRELAPFGFTDYFGGREVRGNPDLEETAIINADTRFEYFPSSREVVAVSAFYKRFEDPIEQIILPAGARGITSFVNAPSASLFGIELEARKNLDVIADVLRPFSVIGNVTFAHSSVGLDPATSALVTSKERPLSLQAPYVFNIALDFDEDDWGFRARALYNVVGPRLSTVGTNGLPDIYEEPKHQLDITLAQKIGRHVEVRASAQNLLDWPTRQTQGDAVVGEYRVGQTFSIGLGIEK